MAVEFKQLALLFFWSHICHVIETETASFEDSPPLVVPLELPVA